MVVGLADVSTSSGSLLETQNASLILNPLNQNLHFNKIPWWFFPALSFKKHWPKFVFNIQLKLPKNGDSHMQVWLLTSFLGNVLCWGYFHPKINWLIFIIIINRLSTSLGIQKTQLFLYSTTTKITLISPALKPGLHF